MNTFDKVMMDIAQEGARAPVDYSSEKIFMSPAQSQILLDWFKDYCDAVKKIYPKGSKFKANLRNMQRFNVPYDDPRRPKLLEEAKEIREQYDEYIKFLAQWSAEQNNNLSKYLTALKELSKKETDKDKTIQVYDFYYGKDDFNMKEEYFSLDIHRNLYIFADEEYQFSQWYKPYKRNSYKKSFDSYNLMSDKSAYAQNAATYKNHEDHPMYWMIKLILEYGDEPNTNHLRLSQNKDKNPVIALTYEKYTLMKALGFVLEISRYSSL